jgi:hypothetical protein
MAYDVPLRPFRQALLGAARTGLRPTEELAPFLPALGPLVPEWAPAAALAEPNPVVVAEGILRFLVSLARGDAPALLIVEDAHWADRETLATGRLEQARREALQAGAVATAAGCRPPTGRGLQRAG